MDLTHWALYLFIAGAAITAAVWHYRLREPPGRGRTLLGVLRGVTIALLVLLLFDPAVPGPRPAPPSVVALLDGSLSMAMPGPDGASAWDEAARAVDGLAPARLMVYGTGPPRSVASPADAAPEGTGSRLAPALRAAAESGAGRVVVFTDGAVEDAGEALGRAREVGAIELRPVGVEKAFNAGVTDVTAPAWARSGETVRIEATVARVGTGAAGAVDGVPDTLAVALRRDGRELARRRVATPPVGRVATVALPFTPADAGAGLVRLEVVLAVGGGSVADDDARTRYVHVADEPRGVALVSFRADQEPRFLLPVLERALGMPVRGWLALAGDRWIRLGAGIGAGSSDDADAPRRALANADVLVLHGVGAGAPAWAMDALESGRPTLVFPADGTAAPFPVAPLQPGDWYVAGEVPASPVAPLLAGVTVDGVPPLTGLRLPGTVPGAVPSGLWTPVTVRLGRRGEPRPVALVGELDGRRMAVALGAGYWRWAFAGPTGRGLYDRLWSAVAGWLAEGQNDGGLEEVRPVEWVVGRGAPVRWRVPPELDSVRVRLTPDGGAAGVAGVAMDSVVAVEEGVVALGGVPPGRYGYVVGAGGIEGEGEVTVEAYSREFTRAATLGELGTDPASVGSVAARGTRPWRSTPWPYVLVLMAVSAEWVLRRRWGLR